MKEKFQKFLWYGSILLAEPSTWRGIAFVAGLFAGHQINDNWGEGAALGGAVSALLKVLLPDTITKLKFTNPEEPQK